MIPSACPFVHSRSTAIGMGIVQCKSTRECAQTNPCISDPKSDRRRSLTTLSAPTSLASLQQAPTSSSRAVLAGFAPPPSHAYDPLTDPAHDPAVDPPSSASALDAVGSMSSASSTASLHGSEPYNAGYNAGSSNAPHGHGQPPGSRPSSTANMHMALSPLQVMYDLQDKELMHLLLPVSPSPERRRQMMGKNRVAAPTAGMHWQSDKQQPPTLPRLRYNCII